MHDKSFVRPSDRAAALSAEQNRKMAASALAFVRGSTRRFYAWLDGNERTVVPAGPDLWICGDCHLGNLGPVGNGDGKLALEIRDLDQTVIGNPAHDLVRLSLSLAMAARGSDLPGVATAEIIEQVTAGYEHAFENGEADRPDDMPKRMRGILRRAARRSWKHLADERIQGVSPEIPLGKRFWPLLASERRAIEALFEQEAVATLATSLRGARTGDPVRVLDAAFWRKGCSSLGMLRYAVLVAIGEGGAERHCLIDIKQAVATDAPRADGVSMPRASADRVVAGARALTPFLGGRMVSARLGDSSVYIRALLPQDLKLEFDQLGRREAIEVARSLAMVVGRAHGRQLDPAGRKAWLGVLRRRTGALDAPSWLWNSVVELVSVHEAAYLNHCRRYALARE